MSDIVSPWPDTYAALFGRKLDKEIAAAMTEEIRARIKDLGGGEITLALRRISQRNQRASEQRYPPTGEETIAEILNGRRQMLAVQTRTNACAHCHSGWVSFKFRVHEGGEIRLNGVSGSVMHWSDSRTGERASCPCKCSAGDALISQLTADVDGRRAFTRAQCEDLRDAVWQAKLTFERQFTQDQKPSEFEAMVKTLGEAWK